MALMTLELESVEVKRIQVTKVYEKRYFPRWSVNKRVELGEENGVHFRSHTRDLSLDGVSVFVFSNSPVRNRVQLKIHFANQESFDVVGRIVWSKSEPTHILLGIAFENLSKNAQELIMRRAFELTEEHFCKQQKTPAMLPNQ